MLEDIINFVVVYKDVFVGEYYEGKKPETIIMIEEVKNKKKITRTYNITTGKEIKEKPFELGIIEKKSKLHQLFVNFGENRIHLNKKEIKKINYYKNSTLYNTLNNRKIDKSNYLLIEYDDYKVLLDCKNRIMYDEEYYELIYTNKKSIFEKGIKNTVRFLFNTLI